MRMWRVGVCRGLGVELGRRGSAYGRRMGADGALRRRDSLKRRDVEMPGQWESFFLLIAGGG